MVGMPPGPLLHVDNLSIALDGAPVVSGVSFDITPASVVGLFGESGCGKTTLALSLMKLLPERYRVQGSVMLGGTEVLALSEPELESIRGARIAMIFQDPLLALNPVMRVSRQVREVLRAHDALKSSSPHELLDLAGLPRARHDAYPHQLSGGERQRVLLAQALACRPALVIADEPFTALDSRRILQLAELFRGLTAKLGTSFLLISHSPGVLARIADHLIVMYAGRIVERGRPADLLAAPLHPYTAGLLRSLERQPDGRLYSIPGNPPGLHGGASGCPFEPRCGDRLDICRTQIPREERRDAARTVSCFKYAC